MTGNLGLLVLFSVCLFSAVPAANAQEQLTEGELGAIALSPAEIADRLDVTDDPFAVSIKISSEPFYMAKKARGDEFLRAFVNRKTGATTYQVYFWRGFAGRTWRFYDRITALGADGPVPLQSTRVESDVQCRTYGCSYVEGLIGEVDESELRWAAKDAAAGVDGRWKFKVFGRNTDGEEAWLLKTEVAGFLQGVDKVKAARPVAPAPTAEATPAPKP